MIDYNKVYNKQVLDNLTLIMRQEFVKYPIRFDNKFIGNSFFKLTPLQDELVDLRTKGAIREYTIQITYNEKHRGRYTKRSGLNNRVRVIERLKEILRRNAASIDEFLQFTTADGKEFLTSDSDNLVVFRRPLLVTSQDQFFITSDNKAFSLFPQILTYDWHDATLESVNYDTESENPSYVSATADFKCLVEEIYA